MSNIIGLRGEPIRPPGEADPVVVKALEEYLEMARSGEIKGMTAVFVHADDTVTGSRKGENTYRSIGLLTHMIHDLCAALSE